MFLRVILDLQRFAVQQESSQIAGHSARVCVDRFVRFASEVGGVVAGRYNSRDCDSGGDGVTRTTMNKMLMKL